MANAARLSELRASLSREERISAALREVGKALGTTLDLDDLLELILGRITELLEADRCTLYLLDEGKGDLVSRLVIGDKVRSIRMKLGHGIAGTVAKTGRAVRIADAYADPRFEPEWDLLTGYRTKSMLVAPLKNHLGRTIGVIQVLNKTKGEQFDEGDEAIMEALSTQAAVAIDNSRLFVSLIQKNRQLLDATEQLERKVEDLQLLFDLEQAMGRAVSLEELAKAVLGRLAKTCHVRGAALLFVEEESSDLVQYVYDSDNADGLMRIGVKAGEGLLGFAMQQSGVVEITDASARTESSPRVEGRYSFAVKSLLASSLEGAEGQNLGAVALMNKQGGRAFSSGDRALLELTSANVSTSVRLFQANRARERGERLTSIGRLLSQVIHDFKTPLTVISGHVQLMQAEDDAQRRAEHVQKILRQFDVMTTMQREVLEFARGERKLFMRRVYLNSFFAEVREQLSHELEGRAVELQMDVDNKAVARFDEMKVLRAVMNLAHNSIDAMAERGGTLSIHAAVSNGELVIRVSDTGPGIPPEIEGRIFQSFVTAGKANGTGLGLTIVKKIVEEHSGHVSVHSSSAGATFEIRLPQDRAGSLPPSARSP
ncbi:MAG TPA: GAF domain-containing sensor histidine kinase [Polyangiaceae bacterium]|nr:GAF domain-containing sensor histidine kinase [Polyangiaceae bacterium]